MKVLVEGSTVEDGGSEDEALDRICNNSLSSLVLVDGHNDDPFLNCNFSSFKFLNWLGRGSYGDIWKAKCDEQTVALKVIRTTNEVLRGVFFEEVEAMRNIDHPHVIGILGACVRPVYAIIMEYMAGGSLDQLLHRTKNISYNLDHVFHWASQCADAMSFIHFRGYVHADLKPANLLLDNGYRSLKIADFGTMAYMSTNTEYRKGSAHWMAPEVFSGSIPTCKSDYYSFGIILWEMIARERPYSECNSAEEILWSVQAGLRPPRIENIPTKLMQMIEGCWHASAKHRPNMEEIQKVLKILCMMYPNHGMPLTNSETNSDEEHDIYGGSNGGNGGGGDCNVDSAVETQGVVADGRESPAASVEEKEALRKKHALIQEYQTITRCLDLFRRKSYMQRVISKKAERRSSLGVRPNRSRTSDSGQQQ